MTSFELIDNPLSEDPQPGHPTTYNDSCDCKGFGNQIPALLSIEDGEVSIVCAVCGRSFLFLDCPELINSDEIPVTLAYHDTTSYHPEPEYDGYWQLTARPVEIAPGTRVQHGRLSSDVPDSPSGSWRWECDHCTAASRAYSGGGHETREQAERALANHVANSHPERAS